MFRPTPAATPRSPSRKTGKALSRVPVGSRRSRSGCGIFGESTRLDMLERPRGKGVAPTVGAGRSAVKERTPAAGVSRSGLERLKLGGGEPSGNPGEGEYEGPHGGRTADIRARRPRHRARASPSRRARASIASCDDHHQRAGRAEQSLFGTRRTRRNSLDAQPAAGEGGPALGARGPHARPEAPARRASPADAQPELGSARRSASSAPSARLGPRARLGANGDAPSLLLRVQRPGSRLRAQVPVRSLARLERADRAAEKPR